MRQTSQPALPSAELGRAEFEPDENCSSNAEMHKAFFVAKRQSRCSMRIGRARYTGGNQVKSRIGNARTLWLLVLCAGCSSSGSTSANASPPSAERLVAEDVAHYAQLAYETKATNVQDQSAIASAQATLHQAQANLAGASTDLKRYATSLRKAT